VSLSAVLAWLRHGMRGSPPLSAYAFGGLVLLGVGLAWSIYAAMTDPRGAARRAGSSYAARLDLDLRSMFLPARGSHIAWLQLTAALSLLASYGILHLDPLLALALLVLVAPPLLVRRMVFRRRARLDDQVHGFALAFANALKTTASIGDALSVTAGVTARPLRDELETSLKQMRLGSTLDDALLAISARAQSSALDVVVSALLIGRQTGGDLPRILEGTAGSLRELKRLEEHTNAVAGGAKQSLAVAAAITASLALFLPRVIPGFFDPLRDTLKGQIIGAQCVIVFLFALFLGYRFTRKSI